MRYKACGKLPSVFGVSECAAPPLQRVTKVIKLASIENILYENPGSSNSSAIKLLECAVIAVNFCVCLARALLCEWRLELGGVGIYGSKDRRVFPISPKIYYIRARILRQRKLDEYTIIRKQGG